MESLFSTTVSAILGNKLYIPVNIWSNLDDIAKESIKAQFIQKNNNPYNCFIHTSGRRCPTKERFAANGKKAIAACYSCKESEQSVKCLKKTKKYLKFDIGNEFAIQCLVNILRGNGIELDIEDRRVYKKFPAEKQWYIDDEKLDKDRSREQKRLAKLWTKEKQGILVCPPRFGKALLTAFIASKLNTRTLILVHKIDLARQFLKDWLNFTSLTKDDIKINPSIEEAKKLKVSICTYQQFIADDGHRLSELRKVFGFIIVDEVHKAGAQKFYEVITSFYAKYRLGVTATPFRRDDRLFLVTHAFGPVLAEGGTEQLSCNYVYIDTNWDCKYNLTSDRGWNALWNGLANDTKRNRLIAKFALKDVQDDHKIMIPVKRHTHIDNLYDLITKIAKKEGIEIRICKYHGKLNKKDREKLQKDITAGKYDIVIGMDSILSLGFNAPPISAIYINVHTLRNFAPDLYQETARIRTKCTTKKVTPLIRIFRDYGHEAIEKSIDVIEREMINRGFTEIEDNSGIIKENKVERSKKGLKKLF